MNTNALPTFSPRRRNTTILVITIALVAAACGSQDVSDDAQIPEPTEVEETTTTTTAATSTTEPAPTTTEPPATTATTEEAEEPQPTNATEVATGTMGNANVTEMQRFLQTDQDEPFYMVNLIRYRDEAQYPDGRATDLTGEEADEIYGQFMGETMLPSIGADVVYQGEVEGDIHGASDWDTVAIVHYPSRTAFASMNGDPLFQEMAIHKAAGVEATTVLATTMIDSPTSPTVVDPPYPATADDPAFGMVHVLDYREVAAYAAGDDPSTPLAGREAMESYDSVAEAVSTPLGVEEAATFEVLATVFGPVGVWEEVRLEVFPSHAAFDALTSDSTWESGVHHREAALENTYGIVTVPAINAFDDGIS